jgi:hypothetical protein
VQNRSEVHPVFIRTPSFLMTTLPWFSFALGTNALHLVIGPQE